MRKKIPFYLLSILIPHIMLIVGIIYLSNEDKEIKNFGLKICQLSLGVMIIGSFVYYLLFTPLFGLD